MLLVICPRKDALSFSFQNFIILTHFAFVDHENVYVSILISQLWQILDTGNELEFTELVKELL